MVCRTYIQGAISRKRLDIQVKDTTTTTTTATTTTNNNNNDLMFKHLALKSISAI